MAGFRKRATYDDLQKLPEHVVGEIIDGELIVSPRPASPHAVASTTMTIDVGGPFDRPPGEGGAPGGWRILDEPELRFGDDVLVPDLAGWRRERMPRIPNVPAFELPPDWVCEVVSPSTARIDRAGKMDIYAHVRVPHLWLVDPLARTLEIFRLENARWSRVATFTDDARVRAEPFDAVELALARWWLEPEPAPAR
jgi:Uma2 family endonuclease